MTFTTEAEMVRYFVERVKAMRQNPWTVYAETAGWDLLLAHRDGYQVGIEAKLSLNAKVIEQALSGHTSYWASEGPDYRAVMVPEGKCQNHLGRICGALGLCIITVRDQRWWTPDLPDQHYDWQGCPNWCPAERVRLPEYVPDVEGGHAAPLKLTPWKIKAIKLCIVLEKRGFVTRADIKALEISPTRWTDAWSGLLERAPERGGFVACARTPDLRAQHPRNYAEIEADFAKWGAAFDLTPKASGDLFAGAA